jgi:hypothetical protein
MKRRNFIKTAAGVGALSGLGDLGFLSQLQPVSAAEARLKPELVRLHPEIEPLVRLLENTPRERVLEEVASRILRGTTYREVLAALFLAGVRNIQPRPVGFKFHAVLVVNSAHIASLASPDSDRWLPLFWAIDNFKKSQADDVSQGDWALGPVEESKVPPGHKAKQAFIEAMENWDIAAGDTAIVSLVRNSSAHEIFELLARYCIRDFREIGHKTIYLANSFRTLEAIGWHHAEPVLRSLVYAVLDPDRDRDKGNPAKLDLPADRPFRHNLENMKELRAAWFDGSLNAGASAELLEAARTGSAKDTSDLAVKLLNQGVAPQSIFAALYDAAGEFLMQVPGILSLHATTFTNAAHYVWQHAQGDETRRLVLLQNAAFLPLFRTDGKDKGIRIDKLEAAPLKTSGGDAIEEIFAEVSKDKLEASSKMLAYLKDSPDPRPLADAARRMIFLKGRDSHDYKFSSAVLEDYHHLAPPWRDRFLAASAFWLKGSGDKDNDLVKRTRAALGVG